jgi:hypothetical protein
MRSQPIRFECIKIESARYTSLQCFRLNVREATDASTCPRQGEYVQSPNQLRMEIHMQLLEDKKLLVSGGTSGIGRDKIANRAQRAVDPDPAVDER